VSVQILAHRGWWLGPDEKNSRGAFERALAAGHGIETDVRDCDGELVISHDMPHRNLRGPLMTLAQFLELYASYPGRPTLALNIKADGLQEPMQAALTPHAITSYFVFDMSVPDTLGWLRRGMTVFTRRSEFETGSSLDARAQGFWLDAFEAPHVRAADIVDTIKAGKRAAVVSPELHGKRHLQAWAEWHDVLALLTAAERSNVMLCTDLPGEASRYFGTLD
jgi:glycerophosphoryl diester phosphodiesterase